MTSRRRWTAVLFLFVVADGMTAQLRGALLPNFQRTFEVSERLLGFVAPAGTVGLVVAVLVVGMLSGRLDVRRAVLAGAVGTAVCLGVVSVAGSYGLLLAFFLLQGASVGVVRALDRPLLGHLYPEGRGRIFNLYALMWALGATAGPLLANAVLAVTDWQVTYVLLTGVFLLVGLAVTRLDRPEVAGAEQSLSWDGLRDVLRRPSVRGMAAALVVSGGIEGVMFTWLPYYAGEFFPQSTANLLLSGFLVMYVPGRLAYGIFADRLPPLTLVLGLALAGVPVAGVAFLGGSTATLVAGVLGFGLLVAGFFPTLSAFGVGAVPQYSGPVNAIATAANFVGLSAAPVVVGVVADQYDIATGMQLLVPAVCCLVVVLAVTRVRVDGSATRTVEA